MKNPATAILTTALALTSVSAFASSAQGTDLEAGSRLTTKQCLVLQAAKHDGSSEADRKEACQWTIDESGPNNSSSTERPRAVDSQPYGSPPDLQSPPPH